MRKQVWAAAAGLALVMACGQPDKPAPTPEPQQSVETKQEEAKTAAPEAAAVPETTAKQ